MAYGVNLIIMKEKKKGIEGSKGSRLEWRANDFTGVERPF